MPRDRPLQRSPLDDIGFHARAGEPDCSADRHELRGLRAHGRHLLLPRHRRRPGGERKRTVAAGERRRPDRAAARARRRVGLRRGRRHDGRGQLRQRQRRHRQRPDLDDGRKVRERAHVRRRQRPRHRRRREQPRLHDRDDARGVGAADRARQRLADGADEGADVGRLLRPLRERNRGHKVPAGEIFTTTYREAGASTQLAASTWTHIAATYNGTTLAVYVNGSQAGQLVTTGPIIVGTGALRIGGNSVWGEWFQGDIDEVRVYNRALAATEIQADMNRPVTNPDGVAPSAPGTLVATGTLSSAQLTWGAATDNTGVVRYNVHRGTSAGFTPSVANRVAQPTGTSYTDPVAAGTYYYRVTAEDAAGNVGAPSNEASAQVGDLTPPGQPGTLGAVGAVGRATLSWGVATDNVGVVRYNVHRGPDASFVPSAANRIAQPTGTGYVDITAPGTYSYKVTAEDAAGNIGAASNAATATVTTDTRRRAHRPVSAAPSSARQSTSPGPARPTTSASRATTSTAARPWASPRTPGTGSRSRPGRATATAASPPAPTTTASPPRTRPATSARSRTSDAATVADATPPTAPSGVTAAAARQHRQRLLDGFDGQRRGRPLQPPPRRDVRLHAVRGEPGRAADRDLVRGPLARARHLLLQAHRRGRGRERRACLEHRQRDRPRHHCSHRSWSARRHRQLEPGVADVDRRDRQRRRHALQRPPPHDGRLLAERWEPDRAARRHELRRHRARAGTYYYRVTAEDAAGNISVPSARRTPVRRRRPLSVSSPPTGSTQGAVPPSPTSPATGTTARSRTPPGRVPLRVGSGTRSRSTAPTRSSPFRTRRRCSRRPASPSRRGCVRRRRRLAHRPLEGAAGLLRLGLYSDMDANRPAAYVFTRHRPRGARNLAVAANTWTHLAATYNGTVLALYVNGTQAATFLTSGPITTNAGALKIGGNAVWGEWFAGLIDEVRIWNHARTATEIQADMNTSISAPDTTPPSTPGTLTATGGLGQVALAWTSRDRQCRRRPLQRPPRDDAPASRRAPPTGSRNRPARATPTQASPRAPTTTASPPRTPPATSARPRTRRSALVTADTTPPTVSIDARRAPAPPVNGTVTVTSSAIDNVAVAGVQFTADGERHSGAEDTAAPYSVAGTPLTAPNGPTPLSAVAARRRRQPRHLAPSRS